MTVRGDYQISVSLHCLTYCFLYETIILVILTLISLHTDGSGSGRVQIPRHLDVTAQTLQIGQMLMSLLHSWGLDPSLDHTCENILGLLKPRVPVSYGLISKSGKFTSGVSETGVEHSAK